MTLNIFYSIYNVGKEFTFAYFFIQIIPFNAKLLFYKYTNWHLTKYYFRCLMNIIKRHATLSTNQEIKEYVKSSNINGPVCLYAESQLEGKGQHGNKWVAEPYKNLTCSFYFSDIGIPVDKQFNLSVYVALAILRTLDELGLNNCQIKWPNDILTGDGNKLCGILIENTLSGYYLSNAVVGIGINVDQVNFPGLPNASSIAIETGNKIGKELVLEKLTSHLEGLNRQGLLSIDIDDYYQKMYRFNEKSTFQDINGNIFHGIIQGVSSNGYLKVYDLNDKTITEYDMKQIKFLDQS